MRFRRYLGVAAVVLMLGMGIPAKAAGNTGEVRVTLDFGDGEVHEGSVLFCRVAVPEGENYRLLDDFGGGLVKREDAVSDALALWLTEVAQNSGKTRILDADGTAWFTDLPEGLYLLAQDGPITGLDDFRPILMTMPSSEQWQLVIYPQQRMILSQCPETGAPFAPVLAAMVLVLSGAGLLLCLERIRRK